MFNIFSSRGAVFIWRQTDFPNIVLGSSSVSPRKTFQILHKGTRVFSFARNQYVINTNTPLLISAYPANIGSTHVNPRVTFTRIY